MKEIKRYFIMNESIMQPFILSIQLVLMMMVCGFIELGLCLAHRTWCLIEYSIKKRVYGNTCSCETGELGFFFFSTLKYVLSLSFSLSIYIYIYLCVDFVCVF
jgi:hypothetical protein